MIGLFAFFYGTLHFLIYFILDRSLMFDGLWDDVVKRPYITVGFTAFVLMIPLALTSTQGWIRRLGGKRWNLLHRLVYVYGDPRRAALLVEGEARHHLSALLRPASSACCSGVRVWKTVLKRRAGRARPGRCGWHAGLSARRSIAALATLAVVAGCAPAGTGPRPRPTRTRQALLTINHLCPGPTRWDRSPPVSCGRRLPALTAMPSV